MSSETRIVAWVLMRAVRDAQQAAGAPVGAASCGRRDGGYRYVADGGALDFTVDEPQALALAGRGEAAR